MSAYSCLFCAQRSFDAMQKKVESKREEEE